MPHNNICYMSRLEKIISNLRLMLTRSTNEILRKRALFNMFQIKGRQLRKCLDLSRIIVFVGLLNLTRRRFLIQ